MSDCHVRRELHVTGASVATMSTDEVAAESMNEEPEEVPSKEEVETKSEDLWIDFDEFCKCFK